MADIKFKYHSVSELLGLVFFLTTNRFRYITLFLI